MTDKHTLTGEVSGERLLVSVGKTRGVSGEAPAGEIEGALTVHAGSTAAVADTVIEQFLSSVEQPEAFTYAVLGFLGKEAP